MTHPVPRDVLRKVQKLVLLPEEVRQSHRVVSITRLTILKSLCKEHETANRFVTYLAGKTLDRVQEARGSSTHSDTSRQQAHKEMMTNALSEMGAWLREPTEGHRQRLWDLLSQMRDEQNEH